MPLGLHVMGGLGHNFIADFVLLGIDWFHQCRLHRAACLQS